MRCIEITVITATKRQVQRLIETWDVLKFQSLVGTAIGGVRINRNMRCIEMLLKGILEPRIGRLIETWDVLK